MITLEQIQNAVKTAGRDDPRFHTIDHLPENESMHLQQNMYEFSQYIYDLYQMRPKVDLSLEIGLAAGGSFKLVRDFVEVDRSIVIDDAQHDKFKNHWNRIKKQARTNITHEIIMSSHTLECAHELKKAVGDEKFDYIFIDADHTYQGILLDIQLVLPYMRKDTLLGFHDTIKSPLERIKVREALAYYVSQGILRVLKEYNTEYGLMIVAPV